jgi:hypothetical protein
MLGQEHHSISKVLDKLLDRIRAYRGRDILFYTHKAAALLYEFKHGDPLELVGYTLVGAENARAQGEFYRARSYYELSSKFYNRLKNSENSRRVKIAIAETFREEAERYEASGNFLAAHIAWSSAIAAFRKAPGGASVVPGLQVRLRNAAAQAREQAQGFQIQVDFTQERQKTIGAMTGLNTDDAIDRFALLISCIKVGELRETALEQMRASPLRSLVTTSNDGHSKSNGR